ncbi:MAG TPA: DUF5694 domain-containing protein, partial [Thermoanaerobaculia bacterium]|nr:DUF5694 domain-containing protein [Thermoanaerobaculia bacterium]
MAGPPLPPDVLGATDPKAKIVMVGVFHFASPGLDAYKPVHTFDVMSSDRQTEIEEVAALLARFQPTKIAVEFRPERQARMDELYAEYLRGEYELGTNEVYQLGFRLARMMGHPRVHLVDAPARHYFTEEEYSEKLAWLEKSGA